MRALRLDAAWGDRRAPPVALSFSGNALAAGVLFSVKSLAMRSAQQPPLPELGAHAERVGRPNQRTLSPQEC
jgi:hypothetical protein